MSGRASVATGLVVVVLAAAAAAGWRAGMFSAAASSGSSQGARSPATQPVRREDIASTTPVSATLGYAASYPVTGQGGGTLTWLPPAGRVIRQGQALYRVDNAVPVVLLYGTVPDWRAMSEGITGADVTQLNHDLVHLGYANGPDITALGWDYYSWQTSDAVQLLEEHLGVSSPSGSLPLGSVVFKPTALRVSTVTGSLGGPASGLVFTATSDRHVVTISLDAAQQSEAKVGDAVTVTLPDGAATPGVISSVGKVASGSGSSATIPVSVNLAQPSAVGSLDQAPVTVNITTAAARDVLAVPVAALLAQSSGGYAVEVIGRRDSRHLVPVTVGPIFDDTTGMVQVAGNLTAGERVAVPAS
jgi:hypothetical protein